MKLRELFQLYSSERKGMAPVGYKADAIKGLTRYTPLSPDLDGLVMFSELSKSSVDKAISDQIDYFSGIGRPFEWKVHTFDTPCDLTQRLTGRGFEPGTEEGFLIYRVSAHIPRPQKSSVRIERVTTRAGIRQVLSVQERIWDRSFPWLESSLLESLPRVALFCAYRGDVPIGTGWIEFPERAMFAELHGGGVLQSERGHGVYSALFDIRVEEAQCIGADFLAVDAALMSRPILLKKGFMHVCDTMPFRRK